MVVTQEKELCSNPSDAGGEGVGGLRLSLLKTSPGKRILHPNEEQLIQLAGRQHRMPNTTQLGMLGLSMCLRTPNLPHPFLPLEGDTNLMSSCVVSPLVCTIVPLGSRLLPRG
jgi:hypothetical protein